MNTDSGIYHKPGNHWYGKTKKGKYMTEADAIKAGYHAARKNKNYVLMTPRSFAQPTP